MTTRPGEQEAVIDATITTSPVAECIGVSRIFGSGATAVRAVRDVNCRISPCARIAVTGPSGSGKSTLLHLIAGLDAPTSGSVRWPALEDSPHPTAVGMVFQGPSLLPSLDVTENVALPMLFAGQAEHTAMRDARAALDLVEISDLAAKLPDELSGGQSQRVAIARVLAARPALILADEPTGRLDHHHADKVITVLLDTAISIGAAVIISTHDPGVAARLPDHWVMRDGHVDTHPSTDDSSAP
ncbi:ABC-type antimicrobial peptide transport system, ATPase component [Mycobacterium sp. JS623]|uniref:ABC transporter ATP-binding protein n=1 Tax=Mycobacterium sp. JS623 TaxID=212767 RepID=UPI0002A5A058|nr:ABC transporter ATP-binding protein [Mycobacterium sp. JS623]AGB26573.1 ABC-type antimicrobial peptide transport system, ATPase component [Mycobacterium sp. JS623]